MGRRQNRLKVSKATHRAIMGLTRLTASLNASLSDVRRIMLSREENIMRISIKADEFRSFSQATQDEIVEKLLARRNRGVAADTSGLAIDPEIDMEDVVGLSFREVSIWMEKASDKTKAGMRVFAEKGPAVSEKDLTEAGVENTSHFQSRVTIRTRTVTGEPDAFLFGWDDWSAVEEGEGRYAVTPETYLSLRRYFRID